MSIETDILGSIGGLRNNSLNHILHANTFENNENLDYEVTTIKHSQIYHYLKLMVLILSHKVKYVVHMVVQPYT